MVNTLRAFHIGETSEDLGLIWVMQPTITDLGAFRFFYACIAFPLFILNCHRWTT